MIVISQQDFSRKEQKHQAEADSTCDHQIDNDGRCIGLPGFAIISVVAILAFDVAEKFWPQCATPERKADAVNTDGMTAWAGNIVVH